MNKEFVDYEDAVALKELGFNEPCLWSYKTKTYSVFSKGELVGNPPYGENAIGAPLYQQAFRWFRKEHFLTHVIERDGGWWLVKLLDYSNEQEEGAIEINFHFRVKDDTYEEAEKACLKKLIELAKSK